MMCSKFCGAIVCGVLLSAATGASGKPFAMTGGPFDGMQGEVSQDGGPRHFILELARENPPSAARLGRIETAFRNAKLAYKKSQPVPAGDKPGIRNPDEDQTRFEGRLLIQCKVGHAFELGGMLGTRIAVACGDRVTQFIMVRFSGDEIAATNITDAIFPGVAPPGWRPGVGGTN